MLGAIAGDIVGSVCEYPGDCCSFRLDEYWSVIRTPNSQLGRPNLTHPVASRLDNLAGLGKELFLEDGGGTGNSMISSPGRVFLD